MKEIKCLVICSTKAKFDSDEINEQIKCYEKILKNNKRVKFYISDYDIITKTILKSVNAVYEILKEDLNIDKTAINYIKTLKMGKGDLLIFVGFSQNKPLYFSFCCWQNSLKFLILAEKGYGGIFSFD